MNVYLLVLDCIESYCIVFYCIVFCSIVFCSILLYFIVLLSILADDVWYYISSIASSPQLPFPQVRSRMMNLTLFFSSGSAATPFPALWRKSVDLKSCLFGQ